MINILKKCKIWIKLGTTDDIEQKFKGAVSCTCYQCKCDMIYFNLGWASATKLEVFFSYYFIKKQAYYCYQRKYCFLTEEIQFVKDSRRVIKFFNKKRIMSYLAIAKLH